MPQLTPPVSFIFPRCRKETHCEFCDSRLPDWKGTLTPQCGANAPAVMNVNFDGRTYSFEVKPGPEGYRQFTEAIRWVEGGLLRITRLGWSGWSSGPWARAGVVIVG